MDVVEPQVEGKEVMPAFFPNTLSVTVVALHQGNIKNDDSDEIFELEGADKPSHALIDRLHAWDTIVELQRRIAAALLIPSQNQRLFFRGKKMTSYWTLSQSLIPPGAVIDVQDTSLNTVIDFYGYTSTAASCKEMVEAVKAGLLRDFTPRLSEEGTGATYFLSNSLGKTIACFKPRCEEQSAPHNPRGKAGEMGTQAMERPILSGEMSMRETAAYLLDLDGFHDVPKTTSVEIRNPKYLKYFNYNFNQNLNKIPSKIGSLQEFIHADHEFADHDPKCFGVREVHKIGILDIRLLNCDRNDENVLTVRDPKSMRLRLIPIDHGLCFPETLEIGWCDWVWTRWPQAKENFDPYTRNFIDELDVEADVNRLARELPLSLSALDNIRISGFLLQIGAKYGLTLFEIASIILRQKLDEPSELELLRAQAEKLTSHRLAHNPPPMVEPPRVRKALMSEPEVYLSEQEEEVVFVQGIEVFADDTPSNQILRTQSCIDMSHQDFTQSNLPHGLAERQGLMSLIPREHEISADLASLNLPDQALSAHAMNVRLASSKSPKCTYQDPSETAGPPPIADSSPDVDHRVAMGSLPNSYSSSSPPINSHDNVLMQKFSEKSESWKETFFYYVKKLIEMKCMKIGKSKLSDEKDVYDMDTIHGTFNGLQELQEAPGRMLSGKTRKSNFGALHDKMTSSQFQIDDEERDFFDQSDEEELIPFAYESH